MLVKMAISGGIDAGHRRSVAQDAQILAERKRALLDRPAIVTDATLHCVERTIESFRLNGEKEKDLPRRTSGGNTISPKLQPSLSEHQPPTSINVLDNRSGDSHLRFPQAWSHSNIGAIKHVCRSSSGNSGDCFGSPRLR